MNTPKLQSRREGFALAAAVLAMLVVGAIVTGGFYAASQEGQVTHATEAGDMALYLAESGMNTITGATTATMLNNLTINGSLYWTSGGVSYGGRTVGTWNGTVTRLDHNLFVVRATGTVTLAGPYSGSKRQLAQLIRLRKADFDNNTAFQVYGNLEVGGSSDINGQDTFPSLWQSGSDTCATPKTGTAAVTANPTSTVQTSGSGRITGTTSRVAMDSADFKVFGDLSYSDVVGMANYNLADGTLINPGASWSGSTCQTQYNTNWGAPTSPTNPCYKWYPIIHANGTLHISSSGTGQGILLVDGDLDITGGFTFYGVAVVLGTLRATGTGGHINGSVFAFGGGDLGSTSATFGNSLVQYSSCSIDRAVMGNQKLARGYPIGERSWIDLSNVIYGY